MRSSGIAWQFLLTANVAVCQTFSEQCAGFVDTLSLPNTTVKSTDFIVAGTNLTFPGAHPSCQQSQVVDADLCRVQLFVTTSATSNFTMEAWLPSNWTGRFLTTGNGGIGGCIQFTDLDYGAALGFASVGTNNGHDGQTGVPFFHNPEVVADYSYRAVHEGAILGKEITTAFYQQDYTKSYYLGCSTGGRQGFKEAQDFPDDFDGIVAGAPAMAFTGLQYRSGSFYVITGPPNSTTYLSSDLWEVVIADIFKQCDGLDGLVDGIIEDPDLCQYRPEALICASDQTESCLTGIQADTVRKVFSPVYDRNGTLIYPRFTPSVNDVSVLWTGEPFLYSTDWWKYVVYEDPSWDPATLNLDDYAAASKLNPSDVDTWNGDLSGARDAGTKILHYHGMADPLISNENSARYRDYVARTMQLPQESLDEFYRYFRISGMAHCAGGPGATFIGNRLAGTASYEPDQNVLTAMVRWVEEGVAPEYILGTGYANQTQSAGVALQRRHCKYPLRNMYDGTGDPASPDSWNCV